MADDIYTQAKNISLDQPFQQAQGFTPRFQEIFKGQQADTGTYLSGLRGAVAGQETYPHIFERIGRELNLPNLQSAYNTTSNTLFNLPHTMSSAARGMPVNANQLERQTASRAAGLAPTVQAQGQALEGAYRELGARTGFTQEQQKKELMPWQEEGKFLSDRLARETSGFTFGMESELNGLLAKLQAGTTLNEGEKNRANALAIAKLQADTQIQAAKLSGVGSFWS